MRNNVKVSGLTLVMQDVDPLVLGDPGGAGGEDLVPAVLPHHGVVLVQVADDARQHGVFAGGLHLGTADHLLDFCVERDHDYICTEFSNEASTRDISFEGLGDHCKLGSCTVLYSIEAFPSEKGAITFVHLRGTSRKGFNAIL